MSDVLFDSALARLRRNRVINGAVMGGRVMIAVPVVASCVPDGGVETAQVEQHDWVQVEGQRNTTMVSYTGNYVWNCSQPNSRFGCGEIAVHLKLRVRPQANVDLNWKRVGVVYRSPNDLTDRTAVGTYAFTRADGDEEWNVTVMTPSYKTTLIFDAWYQDGKGGTFFDDNQGEFHVVNANQTYNVIRNAPWNNTLAFNGDRVSGRLSLLAANLDFDKDLEIIGTTDNWTTVLHFGMGNGEANRLRFVENQAGYERWDVDVDVPANNAQTFQYALRYRHGVVNNAKSYEFWDNNYEQNYRLERPQP